MAKQLQEVTKLRAEIDRLGDEREWVANSPVPPDEIKERASKHLRELSQQYEAGLGLMRLANPQAGITEVQNMLAHEAKAFFPGVGTQFAQIAAPKTTAGSASCQRGMMVPSALQISASSGGGQQVTIPGAPAMNLIVNTDSIAPVLAWCLGDSLERRMHEEIDRLNYRAGPALSERPALLAGLQVDLRKLEEKEEALICSAEDEGTIIPRRHDADPAVVLGYDPDGQMNEDRTRVRTTSVGVA